MVERTVKAEEVSGQSLLDLLREVVKRNERLTIILPDEEVVSISPAHKLEPLPELQGRVPEGWKDAVYGQ